MKFQNNVLEENNIYSVFFFVFFFAPNFREVEGAYLFGSVRPSVLPSVRPLKVLTAGKLKHRLC